MDKQAIENELNQIVKLYKACLDKKYLIQLCEEKGLLKKANQIIQNYKNKKIFEEKYKELLKNNSGIYNKICLINEFTKRATKTEKDLLDDYAEINEESEELIEDLQEKLEEYDDEEKGGETDNESLKKEKELEIGDVSYYQKALEEELSNAFKGLKWDASFDFVDPKNPKKKLKGAYVIKNSPHLYYGEGNTIKDIGSKIYFKVKDRLNRLGLVSNSALDPADIAHDVATLVIYSSSKNNNSLIDTIQKKYNEAVEEKKLPLNISPFLMTVINSRISDVIKSKSKYLKSLNDLYRVNKKFENNKDEIDECDKNIRDIDTYIKSLEDFIRGSDSQIRNRLTPSLALKKNKDQAKLDLKTFKEIKESFLETKKRREYSKAQLKREIDRLQSYANKIDSGMSDFTGLEIVRKNPGVDSEGEVIDIVENTSSDYSIEDIFSDKEFIPDNKFNEFKDKFQPYYDSLFKKMPEIIKKDPNIITKKDVEEFVESAFSFKIQTNDEGNVDQQRSLSETIKNISNPLLINYKKEILEKTFGIIENIKDIESNSKDKDIDPYESFSRNIKESITKADNKFKQFLDYDLPEKIFEEFLEYFKEKPPTGLKAKEKKLYPEVLKVIYYGKDNNLDQITIKDRQKILEYLSEDDIKISDLKNLTRAVKLSLFKFAEAKPYPKITEKMFFWGLLPEANIHDVMKSYLNEEELKNFEKDPKNIPERLKKIKKMYEEEVDKLNTSVEKEEEINDFKTDIEKQISDENTKLNKLVSRKNKEIEERTMNVENKEEKEKIRKTIEREFAVIQTSSKKLNDLNKKLMVELGLQINKLKKDIETQENNLEKLNNKEIYYNLRKNLIERNRNLLTSLETEKKEIGKKINNTEEKVKKSSVESISEYIDVLYKKISN
jgi:hypothetical protein